MIQVEEHRYVQEHGVLGFRFDTGEVLFYGPGVVPGTDVLDTRFIYSKGFKDRAEYLMAQKIVRGYAQDLGFQTVQGLFDYLRGVI